MNLFAKHVVNRISKNKATVLRLSLLTVVLSGCYLLYWSHSSTAQHSLNTAFPKDLKYRQLFDKLNPVVPGWGEGGDPVHLNRKQKAIAEKTFNTAAFNVYISDRISLNRSLLDPRPPECSRVHYNLDNLGKVSIVIIYTNEIWSALLRTIWSVITRSPRVLLKEIILVDDFSDKTELKEPLDEYISIFFKDLVRVIRLERREGLIRARIRGAREATGDVILFLDSHCEATEGWLEPLMKAIKDDRTNVVCPVIDIISDKNFEYVSGDKYFFQIGGFIWSGHFTWIDPDKDALRKNPTAMVKTPTMAGGLFAINREYFFEIGSYDEQMEIWGGENLELSFRLWQCGGKMYISPCSHVGHIFRDYHPYSFMGKDAHGLNTLRTVLVWMDEYSKYFFLHRNDLKNRIKEVDVTERLHLRKRLGCKSFRWYLENIYTEKKYIFDRDVSAFGEVRNPISNLCLDNMNRAEDSKHRIGVYECANSNLTQWTNQIFSFTKSGEIRREEGCMAIDDMANHRVILTKCIEVDKTLKMLKKRMFLLRKYQIWTHTKGGQIKNEHTNLCLSTEGLKSSVNIRTVECNPDDLHQIWWFQKYTDLDVDIN